MYLGGGSIVCDGSAVTEGKALLLPVMRVMRVPSFSLGREMSKTLAKVSVA